MSDTYPWRREFRLKVAALALDPLWTGRVGQIIKPEYFEDDREQEAVAAIYLYKERYNQTPHDVEDVIELLPSDAAMDVLYDIYDAYAGDMSMPKDVAIQWAKEQAVKIAVLESVDDIKRGKLTSVVERVSDAVKVGDDIIPPGIDFVDVDSWLYDIWTDKVQTGWMHIDNHLEGGIGGGELGVIFAPTNGGKSVALVDIAYGAAGLMSGKNVLLFTHEMKTSKYARRIAARMMFRFPKHDDDLSAYRDELLGLASRLMPGKIRIVGGAEKMSVYDVQDSVNRLIDEGFYPDLLIDDYADKLAPPRQMRDRRFEITETYEWLRSYAASLKGLRGEKKDGIPIWTASQVGRQAYSREVIRIEDVAEDIGKANTADVIIAICQTKEEQQKSRCRLYGPKMRDAERGKMWDAKYYGDAQAIITVGETQSRYEEDEI